MVRFIYILTLMFAVNVSAQTKPEGLLEENFTEGTITKLDPIAMDEFRKWSMNVRYLLDEGVFEARNLSPREKVAALKLTVQKTVKLSGENYYQRLVRYTLNRGLLLADYIEEDMTIGSLEAQSSILLESIALAKKYYKEAREYEKNVFVAERDLVLSQAEYGISFAQKMYANVMSVQALNSQIKAQYKILEMLLWDIYSDRDARRYAYAINYIFEELDKVRLDKEALNLGLYRQLNYVYTKVQRLISDEN